jgi:tetratricopeptide (TPR) repeat protein
MRRICCLAVLSTIAIVGLLAGCGQQVSEHANPPQTPNITIAPNGGDPGKKKPGEVLPVQAKGDDKAPMWQPVALAPVDPDQQKYDAALLEAIALLGQKKYAEALTALEAAAKFKDTELVQTEIKKLRLRIDQQHAAEHMLQDIQAVFDQGKVAEAGQLASDALKEFGSTDIAPQLVKLKLQADAVVAGQLNDNAARHKAFRDQGQAAREVGNLRAAALACQQALQFGDDAGLRKTFEEIQGQLAKYDDNRQKAGELRKDPSNLEDAIALLKDAAKAWDTPQVRQELDEYTLALQNRRDRLSVADFEVRGDVGIPFAERVLAEELLPNFKDRFDLVERGQIARVMAELKLEAGRLDNDQDQREVGKLAKVRYLVLGSITRLGGLSANARLVDVRSGLIVQTAKISAANPDDLMAQLPQLAKLLLMNDQERLAYEQELAKQVKAVPPVQVEQPLPPPPELLGPEQAVPPPVVVDNARPPEFGGVKVEDFQRFQPAPAGLPPPLQYGGEAEEAWKRKALYVSLEIGDNLFRRGRYVEATRHFEFGLLLAPGQFDLQLRITRSRPFLPPPPPPVIVVVPPRPRLAIVDFVIVGDPSVVPLGLSSWTPQNLAPYFSPPFEVVDRSELFWWMGRMGMTVRDLMEDPNARRWLGRALNVRYFVLGTITQTASFNVDTYMIDSEYGYLNGRGFVHVYNPFELKCRLGELARMTQTPPGLWQQEQQEYRNYEALIVKARQSTNRGEFTIALGFLQDARKLRPRSIEVQFYFERLDSLSQQRALAEMRQKEFERQQAEALERRRAQDELVRDAERQRILAAQQLALLGEVQRQQMETKRLADQLAAHNRLVLEARVAFERKDFKQSVQIYESALSLKQADDVYRELAKARLELERVTKLRLDAQAALRDVQQKRFQEEQAAKVRAQLEAERKQREAQEAALRKAQNDRDNAEYARLVDQGKQQLANAKHSAAISSFQAAQRWKKSDQVDALLNQAMIAQSRAAADAKGDAARKELEKQLAEEKERRIQAENAAKVNQEKYLAVLRSAQKALADREYDAAILKYQEAGRICKTDVVLTGIQQAQAARDKAKADAALAKEKLLAEQTRLATFQKLMTEGQTAFAGKDYPRAIDRFAAARKVIPENVDAVTALSKAEQARDLGLADARKKAKEEDRIKTFNRLVQDGQDNLAKRQYDAAVVNLTEALKLNPGDPAATKALQQAEKARAGTVKTPDQVAEAKKKADAYQKYMTDGRLALQGKQYDAAIQAFDTAQKLLPGDQTSLNFLKDARKAKDDAGLAAVAAAKKKADDLQRQHDAQKALAEVRAALAGKKLDAAAKALALAVQLAPDDPAVGQLQKDLQRAQESARAEVEAQKQRQAHYDALVAAGKKALNEKRFDAAVKAFGDATALMPGDPGTRDLLKQAQQQLQGAKTAADKKASFDQAIKQGQDLLTAKKYDEAINSFKLAGSYLPGDPTAAAWLKQAEKARADALNTANVAAKVQQLVQSAEQALKAKQLDAAAKALAEASSLAPKDASVLRVQAQLDQARRDAAAQQQAAEFNRLMKEGNAALAGKKYAEAVKFYTDATKLMPTDPAAAKALREANQQWQASKGPPPPTAAQLAEYNKQMQAGEAFDKKKKWEDAIKAYGAALKQIPKDSKATEALNKATYQFRMAEGNRHFTARRFMDAVREFEAALRLYPNDADATAALKKAKDAK